MARTPVSKAIRRINNRIISIVSHFGKDTKFYQNYVSGVVNNFSYKFNGDGIIQIRDNESNRSDLSPYQIQALQDLQQLETTSDLIARAKSNIDKINRMREEHNKQNPEAAKPLLTKSFVNIRRELAKINFLEAAKDMIYDISDDIRNGFDTTDDERQLYESVAGHKFTGDSEEFYSLARSAYQARHGEDSLDEFDKRTLVPKDPRRKRK